MEKPLRWPGTESTETRPRAPFRIAAVRFRPLPVALILITLALMFALGQHIIDRFRTTQLLAQSHLAEVYISRFLLPYARSLTRGEPPDPVRLAEIAALLDPKLRGGHRMALQIWSIDGRLLYTSLPSAAMARHDDAELRVAISGQDSATFAERTHDDDGAPLPAPYIEIYLPIRDAPGDRVIAVGEVYVDATAIMADIRDFERTVMLAIGTATLAFLVMLAASARQSEQLRAHLAAERRLAQRNDALRREADQARLDASRANEATLNLVGAELHDGPIQLLTLAALRPPDRQVATPASGPSQSALIRQAVGQLRELSAGLILPEIEALDLNGVVALAADRFRSLGDVALRVSCPETDVQIDLPRRICLYRVIQEGLTNAARHGDGGRIRLRVRIRAGTLKVTVVSSRGRAVRPEARGPTHRLGLQAMRRRLATFGGTAVLRDVGTATALLVTLPVSSDQAGRHLSGSRSPDA